MSEGDKPSWWQTLPGVLTAIAGIITALTGLIVGVYQSGLIKPSPTDSVAARSLAAAEPGPSPISQLASPSPPPPSAPASSSAAVALPAQALTGPRINLLAAGFFPVAVTATTQQLAAFHLNPFLIAVAIHLLTSLLVGVLYGVTLPMLPRVSAISATAAVVKRIMKILPRLTGVDHRRRCASAPGCVSMAERTYGRRWHGLGWPFRQGTGVGIRRCIRSRFRSCSCCAGQSGSWRDWAPACGLPKGRRIDRCPIFRRPAGPDDEFSSKFDEAPRTECSGPGGGL